jgi:hypothetical protein
MKHRNPAAVFFLSLITFGIYALVWHVKTKGELNRLGAHIPTAWLLIVPLANLYWIWKYCEGVEQVTNGQISTVLALILLLLLSIIGLAILQDEYNKLNLQPVGAGSPDVSGAMPQTVAPVAPPSANPATPIQPPDTDMPIEPAQPNPFDDGPPVNPIQPPDEPPSLPPSPIQ